MERHLGPDCPEVLGFWAPCVTVAAGFEERNVQSVLTILALKGSTDSSQAGVIFCFLGWLWLRSAGTPTSVWPVPHPFAWAAACSVAMPDSLT